MRWNESKTAAAAAAVVAAGFDFDCMVMIIDYSRGVVSTWKLEMPIEVVVELAVAVVVAAMRETMPLMIHYHLATTLS